MAGQAPYVVLVAKYGEKTNLTKPPGRDLMQHERRDSAHPKA